MDRYRLNYGSDFGVTRFCSHCRGAFGACNCGGPVVLPPVFVDAGQVYGPRGALRFLYGDAPANNGPTTVVINNNPPAANNPNNQAGGRVAGPMLPAAPNQRAPRVAAFGDQARGRAWKFIDLGDKQFRVGKHREASQRYRKAAATDPGLGEAHFRQGWAELARGELGRASVAFRRGLRVDPAWPTSDFVLEELLDQATREQVFARLANRLADLPNDVDATFVLGVAKHFDGEIADARRAFTRVAQLTGGDPATRLFLPNPEPADAR